VSKTPTRNIGLELVRATEAAALASARWVGRGDKHLGDQAGVDGMRLLLNRMEMAGEIVVGEGEKDHAPMLYVGESVGTGDGLRVDIAVDPVEGTNLLAKGLPNSLSVVGISTEGSMARLGSSFYMDKISVGPEGRDVVDLDQPLSANIRNLAKAKDVRVEEITVVALDRPRNEEKIASIRGSGARVRLISDGDVSPSVMAALPGTGIDMVVGIGGTPEGIITACALRGLGGTIQGRLAPQSDEERKRLELEGVDLAKKYTAEDLVTGEEVFFAATAITEGDFLKGVRYTPRGPVTQSLVTRAKSGTWRIVETHHLWEKTPTH